MPTFRYTAKRGPHNVIEGVYEAADRAQVIAHLTAEGYIPVRIVEVSSTTPPSAVQAAAPQAVAPSPVKHKRVPARAVNIFTRQFASLVRSQVSLLKTLDILTNQTPNPTLQRTLRDIADGVQQGQTLSESMGRHSHVFPPLYINLVRSGEVGGMLDTVLDRLAAQAGRDDALKSKVRSALTYPMFVGLVGLGTVVFLLTVVMPRLLSLFAGFGGTLPLPTRILLAVSSLMTQWWFWGLAAALAAGGLLLGRLQGPSIRQAVDRSLLRLPVVGPLIHQLEISRFARSFGLLVEHGVPIFQAIEVALPVVSNHVLKQQLDQLPAMLQQGGALAESLEHIHINSPFFVNTVAVGEEGGRLAEALAEVAHYYEQEAERTLGTVAALLEPVMVLLVGGLVGFIVMAVLLPIFELGMMSG